jgi:hypothetical protein
MVTKSEKAVIESAFGFDVKNQPPADKNLTFPISYDYEYRVFATPDEALNAGYNFVALANTADKNKAKASAYQKAINVLKPDVNSPEETRKRLVKDLVNLGKTQAEAEALVGSI